MANDRDAMFALMRRFNRLGSVLPSEDDVVCDKQEVIAGARLLLAEMERTKREIDRMLGITEET